MRQFNTVLGLTLLVFAAGAQAHTHLKQSTPLEGRVVTAASSSAEASRGN